MQWHHLLLSSARDWLPSLCRLCCALQVYRGMGDAACAIMRERGFSGLYRGLGVTLVEIMPYAALQVCRAPARHRRELQ
jgi:hypothetical protein